MYCAIVPGLTSTLPSPRRPTSHVPETIFQRGYQACRLVVTKEPKGMGNIGELAPPPLPPIVALLVVINAEGHRFWPRCNKRRFWRLPFLCWRNDVGCEVDAGLCRLNPEWSMISSNGPPISDWLALFKEYFMKCLRQSLEQSPTPVQKSRVSRKLLDRSRCGYWRMSGLASRMGRLDPNMVMRFVLRYVFVIVVLLLAMCSSGR